MTNLERFRVTQILPDRWRIYDAHWLGWAHTERSILHLIARLQRLGCTPEEALTIIDRSNDQQIRR